MATTRPTKGNPTGLATFDHGRIAALPEYQAAGRALNALVHAMNRAGIDVPIEDWLLMAPEIVAGLPFADDCERCQVTTFPYAAEVDTPPGESVGGVSARYRCDSGHTWTCGWSTNAPLFG